MVETTMKIAPIRTTTNSRIPLVRLRLSTATFRSSGTATLKIELLAKNDFRDLRCKSYDDTNSSDDDSLVSAF